MRLDNDDVVEEMIKAMRQEDARLQDDANVGALLMGFISSILTFKTQMTPLACLLYNRFQSGSGVNLQNVLRFAKTLVELGGLDQLLDKSYCGVCFII